MAVLIAPGIDLAADRGRGPVENFRVVAWRFLLKEQRSRQPMCLINTLSSVGMQEEKFPLESTDVSSGAEYTAFARLSAIFLTNHRLDSYWSQRIKPRFLGGKWRQPQPVVVIM